MKRLWWQMACLAAESQAVVALRMAKLARGGPKAATESRKMVDEKVAAAFSAAGRLATGASPTSIVGDYRRKVRANVKRLSKG